MASKLESPARPKGATDVQVRETLSLLMTVVSCMKQAGKDRDKPDELEAAFESGEIGQRHVNPLIVLTIQGEQSVSQLAEQIGLTLGTTSLLVGELSRAGFVERREDPDDRRRTIVSVPEAHAKLMRPAIDETLAPLRRALDRMKPAERRVFLDSLAIVAEESGAQS